MDWFLDFSGSLWRPHWAQHQQKQQFLQKLFSCTTFPTPRRIKYSCWKLPPSGVQESPLFLLPVMCTWTKHPSAVSKNMGCSSSFGACDSHYRERQQLPRSDSPSLLCTEELRQKRQCHTQNFEMGEKVCVIYGSDNPQTVQLMSSYQNWEIFSKNISYNYFCFSKDPSCI